MSDKVYDDYAGWTDKMLKDEYQKHRNIVKNVLDEGIKTLNEIAHSLGLTHYEFYQELNLIYLRFFKFGCRVAFYHTDTPEDKRIFIGADYTPTFDVELSPDMSDNKTLEFFNEYVKFTQNKTLIEMIIPVIQNIWYVIGTSGKIYSEINSVQYIKTTKRLMEHRQKKYEILSANGNKIYIMISVPDDLSSVLENLDDKLYTQGHNDDKEIIIDYYVRNGLSNRFFSIPYTDKKLHLSQTKRYTASDGEVKIFEDYLKDHLEIIDKSLNPSNMREQYKNKLI